MECRRLGGCRTFAAAKMAALHNAFKVIQRGGLEHPRLTRHQLGETLRAVDFLRLSGGGIGDERGEAVKDIWLARYLVLAVPVGDSHSGNELSVPVQAEVEVVGEDDRVERGLVTVELRLVSGAFFPVEIAVAEILCLHVEHRKARPVLHDVIGCTAVRPLRLVHSLKSRRKRVNERGERTPE